MKLLDLQKDLTENVYPGRGIIIGRSEDNKYGVIAYWIMGRSENSRNRVFVTTEDGIQTEAFDPAKLTDPSLIIYHPVRTLNGMTIVTNGDQTDTIRDFMQEGKSFASGLNTREFEPDAPNYTPRISGLLSEDGSYKLSILKSLDGDPSCCCRHFFKYDHPKAGLGHMIHTYQGDGNPLPSFDGEPKPVRLTGDLESFGNMIWNSLNADNKVSLFVRYVDLENGSAESLIYNRNQH